MMSIAVLTGLPVISQRDADADRQGFDAGSFSVAARLVGEWTVGAMGPPPLPTQTATGRPDESGGLHDAAC